MRELLIGCGNNRDKRIHFPEIGEKWDELITLDVDGECNPDWVCDLNDCALPFGNDYFDAIHAYQVLEHTGTQGDWQFFFRQFAEFWRVLKPGGFFCGTVPMWDGPWAFGDPGHTRVIPKESLIFLDQRNYANVGKTSITDYRRWWKGNFETLVVEEGENEMGFVLKAIK